MVKKKSKFFLTRRREIFTMSYFFLQKKIKAHAE